MSRERGFDDGTARPADAQYGTPQPCMIDPRRGKKLRKVLRNFRNRSAARSKSRRGLGRRKYR